MGMFKDQEKNKIIVQKQNIGNSGEYYIAARLSALNFTVTITLGRAERYDIIAVNQEGRTYKFSIKTRYSRESSAFQLSKKDADKPAVDFFYVFVRLNEFKSGSEPEFWVIPSKIVSKLLDDSHSKWLATPGRNGRKRVDNPMRKLPIDSKQIAVHYYSIGWQRELEKYYKNFSLVK
jgi:hypothetical protein